MSESTAIQTYDEKRLEFLNTIHPGDLVSWTTFDGSSVWEVAEVTADEIAVRFEDNTNVSRWPRSGMVHREHYGGFDEKLGPPSQIAVEYYLRRKHRRSIDRMMKDMDANSLRSVDEYMRGIICG